MGKIKKVIIAILVLFGALFMVILFLPHDGEGNGEEVSTVENAADNDVIKPDARNGKEDQDSKDTETEQGDSEDGRGDSVKGRSEDVEQEHKNNATVEIPETERTGNSLKFKTVTLDNREISQEIFSEYDLTLVHVWGTYCGPCISEMGEYAALHKGLPDNVNMVAILCDVYEGMDNNVQDAEDILNENDAEFTNLRLSNDVYKMIEGIQYVPSSFFVDSEGCLVGDILEGVGFEETKQRLEGYLK